MSLFEIIKRISIETFIWVMMRNISLLFLDERQSDDNLSSCINPKMAFKENSQKKITSVWNFGIGYPMDISNAIDVDNFNFLIRTFSLFLDILSRFQPMRVLSFNSAHKLKFPGFYLTFRNSVYATLLVIFNTFVGY